MVRNPKPSPSGVQRTAHNHANGFHPYNRPAAASLASPSLTEGQLNVSCTRTPSVETLSNGQSDPSKGVRRWLDEAPRLGEPFEAVVGSDDGVENFTLHESLASKHSQFIEAALKEGWTENETRKILFPDHHPVAFDLFVRFIYFNAIFCNVGGFHERKAIDDEWEVLAAAWVLGDNLEAADFKDALVDAMIDKVLDAHSNCRLRHGLHQTIYPKKPTRIANPEARR